MFDRTGYAEEARNHILSLDRLGIPVVANPRHWRPWAKRLRPEDAERIERLVMVERPRRFVHVMHSLVPALVPHPDAVLNVARTMWETDGLPPGWAAKCNAMDEVWVPSEFNVETFARAGVRRDKLHVVPESLQLELFDPAIPPIELENVAGFVFLAVFGWSRRKGWDLLVRAYVEEFAPDEPVTLVLKLHPQLAPVSQSLGELRAYVDSELRRPPATCPRIVVLDTNPGAEGVARLYRAADAYVLPARGEGWGRPYMEAMAMGLPTIGTRWSGNLAFMNDRNSYLIDCDLTAVSEAAWREWPAFRGQRWAEPSVPHLRRLMRHVFVHRDEARAKGARARADVRALCSWENVARIMTRRLEGAAVSPAETPGAEVTPVVSVTPRGGSLPGSLTAIVLAGHDERTTARAIASVTPVASEVILVSRGHSGSRHDTPGGASLLKVDPTVGDGEAWEAALPRARGDRLLLLGPGESLDEASREEVARSGGPACRAIRVLSYVDTARRRFTPQWDVRLLPAGITVRCVGRVRPRVVPEVASVEPSGIVLDREEWALDRGWLRRERDRLVKGKQAASASGAYDLGMIEVSLGLLVEAEGHLLVAATRLSELPSRPHVVAALANAYLALSALVARSERWAEAAGFAYSAAQLVPELPEGYELMGHACAGLGLQVIALRAYERAVTGEERLGASSRRCSARSLVGMAQVHIGRTEWAEAHARLERANELRPDTREALAALSRVARELGRATEADRFLAEALARWDVPPEAWLVLAEVYRERGQLDEARRALEAAIAAEPGSELYRAALDRLESASEPAR